MGAVVRLLLALQAFVLVAPTDGNGTLQTKTPSIQPLGFPSSTLEAVPELSNNDVYEVSLVEGGAPPRGTGGHPLYSLDRDDWVRVRDLQVGERLQTAEGAVTVEALEKVRGVHRVYNLEVEGDHEYLVGEAGVRAHNSSALNCGWSAPKIFSNRHGQLTNGRYTLDGVGMIPHTTGRLASGKSQFLHRANADQAVLDAAAYADEAGLWVGNKAKVRVASPIGVLESTGELIDVINVYRTKSGFVHGSPGTPLP